MSHITEVVMWGSWLVLFDSMCLGILWWSVNLSDNWAFNVWTVNFIKTPTIINKQVNCNMLLFVLGSVCIVPGWSIHSHPHTRWYSQSQTFTPSYLICMCISARQNVHIYVHVCVCVCVCVCGAGRPSLFSKM